MADRDQTRAEDFKQELSRFKKGWLRQLQKAYVNILWQRGIKVKAPAAIGLMKGKTIWGRWVERERRILISQELILEHPWAAVLGILAHEMTHQLVSEQGSTGQGSGGEIHGPAFQAQGARLGLDPFYLNASVDLQDESPQPWPDREGPPVLDQSAAALEKVKKLLALTGSPVEAEAQAAMNAAARLMARHNLEMLDKAPGAGPAGFDAYEYRVIAVHSSRLTSRLGLIAHILGRHFFVKCLFVPGYDPRTDTEGHDLEIMGRLENTRLAEHIFHFLMERTESLWQAYRRTHPGRGLIARNSFILGLLEGFNQKLDEAALAGTTTDATTIRGEADGGFSALVLAKDRGLTDFFKNRHPHVRTSGSRRRRYDPESDRAGRQAGQALNFNRPLEDNPPADHGAPRRLPPAPETLGKNPANLFGEPL